MEDLHRMKKAGVHKRGIARVCTVGQWVRVGVLGLGMALLSPLSQAADDEKKEKDKSSSLGGLLNSLKDLKVPDSVSKLPEQLKELKDAYLKTAQTVEDLQQEVDALRKEVKSLREEQAQKKDTVVTTGESLQVQEVTAEQLVAAFEEDSASAKQNFKGRYMKVEGAIQGFETRVKEIVIFLRAESSDSRVKCSFKRDNNFHVEVVSNQGRLVSRNDRTTLLTIGQPLTIVGTCTGRDIDVTLVNCHAEGLDAKRKFESE